MSVFRVGSFQSPKDESGVADILEKVARFGLKAVDFDLWQLALDGKLGPAGVPRQVLASLIFLAMVLIVWMILANVLRFVFFIAKAIVLRRTIGRGWWVFMAQPMGGGLLTLLLLRRHLWQVPEHAFHTVQAEEEEDSP